MYLIGKRCCAMASDLDRKTCFPVGGLIKFVVEEIDKISTSAVSQEQLNVICDIDDGEYQVN